MLLAHVDSSEALLSSQLVLIHGEVFGPVPLGSMWLEFSLGEVVRHLLNHLLVFVQELVIDEE